MMRKIVQKAAAIGVLVISMQSWAGSVQVCTGLSAEFHFLSKNGSGLSMTETLIAYMSTLMEAGINSDGPEGRYGYLGFRLVRVVH